ncbi:MAG: polyketide synthase dehydratase domain-containing protein [Deltaproteobacteria bacterium]|nr:polyketide synthase dehydratase domain-containing protein [Deltaproteobacteria bacterium]
MSNYLKTMEHFLETQQQIMQTFLSTAVEEGQDDGREKTSKVKVDSPLPSPEKADDHPLTLKQDLIEIVSEKTGYPKEMLDLNLDMEADLGIDSIKRTEIMGVLNERYGGKLGQEMDQVSALKTLKQVVDFLEGHLEGVVSPTLEPTKVINKSEGEEKKAAFSESAEAKPFPFIGKITSLVPGQKLEALRRISLDEDLYLKDHTIGGKISCMDNTLRPLAVMPLTLSMEILAEAASLLVPDKVLVSMKNIHAYKWIALEESSYTLQIVACRTQEADNQVEVKIYNYEEGKSPLSHPMIEGTMVFADTYPEAKVPDSFSLQSKRTSKWTPKQLYTEAMFHGPCWQGVSSIDSWGEDGSIATLKVLSASGFFRSDKNPEFVTDPIALDAAGQIVGFWTMEHLKSGFLVFPFRVKALHIYRPQLPLHQKVKCQARIKLLGTTQVLSNIDLIGEDGHIWMRLEGWEDKRFDLPSEIYPFLLSPIKVIPSMRWDAPIKSFPDPSYFCCFRIGDPFQGDKTFWKLVFSHLILNRNERKVFHTLGKSEKRQTEWLMGRLVAKDAVRMTLKEHYGIEVGPADIKIEKDVYGNPVPGGAWSDEIETVPALSLAHTNGLAVAIACHLKAGQRLGIDIEGIRSLEQGVEKIAFTQKEQSLLDSVEESLRQQWVFRFWCAKEAVAKALGRGLIEGPKSLSVQRLDVKTGALKIALQGKLADEFPDLADATVLVHTAQEKDYIFASTICQRD